MTVSTVRCLIAIGTIFQESVLMPNNMQMQLPFMISWRMIRVKETNVGILTLIVLFKNKDLEILKFISQRTQADLCQLRDTSVSNHSAKMILLQVGELISKRVILMKQTCIYDILMMIIIKLSSSTDLV